MSIKIICSKRFKIVILIVDFLTNTFNDSVKYIFSLYTIILVCKSNGNQKTLRTIEMCRTKRTLLKGNFSPHISLEKSSFVLYYGTFD